MHPVAGAGHPRGARRGLEGQSLDEVARLAGNCTLCRLCHTRSQVVFGTGNSDADVMFVTEAPGYHDDRAGEPFAQVEARQLFDELLADVSLTRDDVYVTSVVKCRPQHNRSPFPDEVEQCEGFLFRQVQLVQPRVVCALGNVAIRLLTGKPHALSRVHGTPMNVSIANRAIVVYPLFHPAAAAATPALRAMLRNEFRRVPSLVRAAVLNEDVAHDLQAAPVSIVPTHDSQQRASEREREERVDAPLPDAHSQLSFLG